VADPEPTTKEARIAELRAILSSLREQSRPGGAEHERFERNSQRETAIRELVQLVGGVDSLRLAGGVDVALVSPAEEGFKK
jgi:hypothetical protein